MIRALCVCLIVTAMAGGQAPSFSGTWKLNPMAEECRGGGRAPNGTSLGCGDGGGARMVCLENVSIEMSAAAVKVERVINGGTGNSITLKMDFPLDGSPIRHPVAPCRDLPTDPAKADRLKREQDAAKPYIEPGSDDMTTKATRDGSVVVLRSTYATARAKGETPELVIEQTERLSISPSGNLVVDYDRTGTNKSGLVTRTRGRLVYSRTKTGLSRQ